VVVDDGELARALVEQRTHELGGNARDTEAADEDGRAVLDVGERLGGRSHYLVEHGRPRPMEWPPAGATGEAPLTAGSRSARSRARAAARRGWRTRRAARGSPPDR